MTATIEAANSTRLRTVGGAVVTWTPTRIVGRTRTRAMGIRLGTWACNGCGGHAKECLGTSATDHAATCDKEGPNA
jgi:hypothetical protein